MARIELRQKQLDAIKKLATIGSRNMATRLSELLHRRVQSKMPEISLEALNNIPSLLGGVDSIVNVLYMIISGHISGSIILILPIPVAPQGKIPPSPWPPARFVVCSQQSRCCW